MKNSFQVLILLFFTTCAVYGQSNPCENSITYGDIELCLPSIPGMKSAYHIPNVKAVADQYEDPRNMVLAFYLNDATFAEVDKVGQVEFDDYFKIYANKQLSNYDVDDAKFSEFSDMISSQFVAKEWEEIKSSIENRFQGISLGQPVLIEDLPKGKDEKTLVLLMTIDNGVEQAPLVMGMNLISVKKRLLFTACYKRYVSEETVKQVREKSLLIASEIKKINR